MLTLENFSRKAVSQIDKEFRDSLVSLRPLDLGKCKDSDELLAAMSKTAFGGRSLGEAADVLVDMINDKECFKVMTLSGAMTIAKMGLVICDMIEKKMVDCIISTGALMTHGFVEAAGMAHYKNPNTKSDEDLYREHCDRVYDTLELEENLDDTAEIMNSVLSKFDAAKPISSHILCKELGRYLHDNVKGRGILKSAFENNIPIFIPAFTDSELALDFGVFNRKRKIDNKPELKFDSFMDLEYYTELIFNSKKQGIFTIGGGVPRNWAQQVGPYLDLIRFRILEKGDKESYKVSSNHPYVKKFYYGVRICPEPVHWGGLSGCSYSEGVSWGKFIPKSLGGKYAEVLCDATIAWPILIKAVIERLDKNNTKKG